MPRGINSSVPPHLAVMLSKASKAQLVNAVRDTARYYEQCAREHLEAERWQTTLTDALHVQLADARHSTSGQNVQKFDYAARNYGGIYGDQ
jgi:hypothetical protein